MGERPGLTGKERKCVQAGDNSVTNLPGAHPNGLLVVPHFHLSHMQYMPIFPLQDCVSLKQTLPFLSHTHIHNPNQFRPAISLFPQWHGEPYICLCTSLISLKVVQRHFCAS